MKLKTKKLTLYERCAMGDRQAQLQLYDQYAKAMYNVSWRMVKDSAAAQDIMQESMITAFNKIEQWSGEASYGAWLKRIVINKSLTYLKKEKRLQTTSYDAHEMNLEQLPQETVSIDVSQLNKEKMYRALDQLSPNYRTIINLYYIEGMDHEEIGDIMGLSYAMCRTTLSRAKSRLKKYLENE